MKRTLLTAFAALALSFFSCRSSRTSVTADTAIASASIPPPGAAAAAGSPARDGGATPPVGTPSGPVPIAPLPEPPARVKITIKVKPKRARVSWGKKPLGETPLQIERMRDSGPMDLVVRAEGHLALHVRAYTFKNDTLSLELTKVEDAGNLLGAKKAPPPPPPVTTGTEPPPGSDGIPPAGVPVPWPAPSATSPTQPAATPVPIAPAPPAPRP